MKWQVQYYTQQEFMKWQVQYYTQQHNMKLHNKQSKVGSALGSPQDEALDYRWRELPQIFLSRQTRIVFRDKYILSRHTFVETKDVFMATERLSRPK